MGGFGLGLGIGMFGGGGVQQPQRGTPVKVPDIYDPMQLPGLMAFPGRARIELKKLLQAYEDVATYLNLVNNVLRRLREMLLQP